MSEEAAITYLCICVLGRCWRGVSMCVPAGSDGGGTTTVPWRAGAGEGQSVHSFPRSPLSPAQTWTQGGDLAVGAGGESGEVKGRQTPAAFSTEGSFLPP